MCQPCSDQSEFWMVRMKWLLGPSTKLWSIFPQRIGEYPEHAWVNINVKEVMLHRSPRLQGVGNSLGGPAGSWGEVDPVLLKGGAGVDQSKRVLDAWVKWCPASSIHTLYFDVNSWQPEPSSEGPMTVNKPGACHWSANALQTACTMVWAFLVAQSSFHNVHFLC